MKQEKLITKIMSQHLGKVFFSRHALEELKKDGLTTLDAINVLKSPGARIYTEGELERGSYRYRLETTHIMIVVSFLEWARNRGSRWHMVDIPDI